VDNYAVLTIPTLMHVTQVLLHVAILKLKDGSRKEKSTPARTDARELTVS